MNVHRIEKLEKQLASRPGLIERVIRAERATPEDLADPRVLTVSFRVVHKDGNNGPQEGPVQKEG